MNEMFLGVSRVWCAEPKDKGLLGGGGMVPEVSRVTILITSHLTNTRTSPWEVYKHPVPKGQT